MIKYLFRSQLRKNVFSGVACTVVNTGVTFVSYPLYLHYLGYEKLGVWMVLSTVLTFIHMCSLGMGPAVTKLVAEEHGRGNEEGIRNYVATALWTLAALGCLALAVLIVLRKPIIGLFHLGPENAEIAERLLPYVGITTVYAFLVQVLTATLSGLGRMDQVNYRDSVCRAIALGVSVVLLALGYGIMGLLIGMAVSYLLLHVTSVFLIRRLISLRLLTFTWDAKRFSKLVRFGSGVFGAGIMSMLMNPFNKLMISRCIGVQSVPIYEIAFRASMQVRSLIEIGLRAVMPEVSKVGAQMTTRALQRISEIYRRSMKVILLYGICVYATLIIAAPWLLRLWLRNGYVDALPQVFRIMLAGTFVSLVGVPGYHTIMGMGRVRHALGAHSIQAITNVIVILCFTLALKLSLGAVTLSTSIGMAAATVYLIVQNKRILQEGLSESVRCKTSEGRVATVGI